MRTTYLVAYHDDIEKERFKLLDETNFDETFYQNLNIDPKTFNTKSAEIKQYSEFLYEWHKWLERNPQLKGFNKNLENYLSLQNKLSEEEQDDEDTKISKILAHYTSEPSIEERLYLVTLELYKISAINSRGKLDDPYKLRIEVTN